MANSSYFGYLNTASGAGTANSIDYHGNRYAIPYLTFQELDLKFRSNWMAMRVISVPASDCTRAWREFTNEDSEIVEAREQADLDLNVRDTVRRAIQWADLYGGAAIVLGMKGEAAEDLTEPLDLDAMRQGDLEFLHVVIKDQMNPSDFIELDPLSPNFRRPTHYTITSSSDGVMMHASRFIIFTGAELGLYGALQQIGWGDSKLTSAWNLYDITEKLWLDASQLVSQANIDVLGIEDYRTLACTTPEALGQLAASSNNFKSNYKTLYKDREDTFDRHQIGNFGGIKDLLELNLSMIAGSNGMPVSKLLGTSVGASVFGGKGDGELTDYYDSIRERQNRIFTQMKRLDKLIEISTFGDVVGIKYEWKSLIAVDEAQQADIVLKRAQTDSLYLNDGVISEEIIGQRLREDGTYNISAEYLSALDEVAREPDDNTDDTNADGNFPVPPKA
jgi:phage-related protein (TIGR01555 family)